MLPQTKDGSCAQAALLSTLQDILYLHSVSSCMSGCSNIYLPAATQQTLLSEVRALQVK